MRTKALLSMAALAAGALTSMAQSNVYSLNVVGYVNNSNAIVVSFTNALTLSENPLVATDPTGAFNNSVSNVLANVTPGSQIFYWNGGGFSKTSTDPFQPTAVWSDPTVQIPPGVGFFFDNGGTPQTYTFVGHVAQWDGTASGFQWPNVTPYGSNILQIALANGYNLVASAVPQAGYLADLGLVATPGDYVQEFISGGFVQFATDPFSPTPVWSTSNPNYNNATWFDVTKGPFMQVAQGFFYNNQSGAATKWSRAFTVH